MTMSVAVSTFDELIAPVTPNSFHTDYHGRRWLHVPGKPHRFADILSWDTMNHWLSSTGWSHASLRLAIDAEVFPPSSYSTPGIDRNRNQVLYPDPAKVADLLRDGASIVMIDVDDMSPGIRSMVRLLERAFHSKCTANLYYSQPNRQAKNAHCDTQDVFALQIFGEKTWRLYEGRSDNPVSHADFSNRPQDEYDRMKGALEAEVPMRPGDLLYVPRGQFHEAIAHAGESVHITFANNEPNGLDWLSALWERAVHEPEFRANLPLPDGNSGREAMGRCIEALTERLCAIATSPEGLDQAMRLREAYGFQRAEFQLPLGKAGRRFRTAGADIRLQPKGQGWRLNGAGVDISLDHASAEVASWMLRHGSFDHDELTGAFPGPQAPFVNRVVDTLKQSGILVEI